MYASPTCHVWTGSGAGMVAARVKGQATVLGPLSQTRGAYFSGDNSIVMPGTAIKATYAERKLTFHGVMAGPAWIGDGAATVPNPFGDSSFRFNDACTDRDAAVGITSIVAVIATGGK
jgi:hypothetical protein